MLAALDAAMYQAGCGTVLGRGRHCLGPLIVGPTDGAARSLEVRLLAGLFSALVSPRRNPAGQITRTGSACGPDPRAGRRRRQRPANRTLTPLLSLMAKRAVVMVVAM